MQARYLIPVLALTYLFCVACGGSPTRRPALHPPVTPQQEYRQEAAANNPGSLFAASEADTLFEDSRARRVGDIVVVKLVENTKAQNKAETSSNKKSSNNYQVADMFNRGHAGFIPFMPIGPQPSVGLPILDTDSASGINSTGKTKRENYVTTALATRVLFEDGRAWGVALDTLQVGESLVVECDSALAHGLLRQGGERHVTVNPAGKPSTSHFRVLERRDGMS